MGSTHHPTVPGGSDVGRNQAPKRETDATDVRGGTYRDPESMRVLPGGAATTRCKGPSTMAPDDKNGPAPRDRSNRSA